jgi:hypothetical protein
LKMQASQNSQHRKKNLKKKTRPCTPNDVNWRHNTKIGGNSITFYLKQVHHWKVNIQFNWQDLTIL